VNRRAAGGEVCICLALIAEIAGGKKKEKKVR